MRRRVLEAVTESASNTSARSQIPPAAAPWSHASTFLSSATNLPGVPSMTTIHDAQRIGLSDTPREHIREPYQDSASTYR